MEIMKNAPAPLRRKIVLTILLGFLCLLTGTAMFLFSKDRIMLLLSAVVCSLCLFRAWSIYKTVCNREYEIVEGTCVGITPKPLRKYRKILIMDDKGNETSLLLGKHTKMKIGYRYRFYFKKTQRLSLSGEYFDSALSNDYFLGFEELGEYDKLDT